jgi:Helix-turn-helix domain
MSSDMLTTAEAAAYLSLAPHTLNVWRITGRGPAFVKIGRRIAYRKAALDEFITARTFSSTSQYPQ